MPSQATCARAYAAKVRGWNLPTAAIARFRARYVIARMTKPLLLSGLTSSP